MLLPAVAYADRDCKETAAGACFTAHGRYAIYVQRDSIWIIGTHRLLDTTDDKLDNILMKKGEFDYAAYGDFTVCPLTKYKPGHLQSACIQSYRNILIRKWPDRK